MAEPVTPSSRLTTADTHALQNATPTFARKRAAMRSLACSTA